MAEIQDLYDIHRRPTGEIFTRGAIIPQGRFRLGVQVWLRNCKGEYLLTQRHPAKKLPLLWEPTGGAVRAGEDTLAAAVREVSEEIGIALDPAQLRLIRTALCQDIEFLDTYLAEWNGSLDQLTLQSDEIIDAMWASRATMADMDRRGLLACDWQYLDFPPSTTDKR